ncbi:helix-turn-helix domain-containing protein [Sphingomonas sp. GlSt437]|uniref:helix-turn-helix transcriptional regulator n=1 Tax=Sphingomonas sp. GlSt437 TaxID=3389970 RepID=UPI003A87633C
MADIGLEFVVAPPCVAHHISLFYHFRAPGPGFDDTERAQIAQLRFRLSPGAATYHFADGTEQFVAGHHLMGPTSGASRVVAEGEVRVFGMGVTPAGWAAMVGVEASSLLNRVVDARQLFGERIDVAAAALAAATETAEMVEIGRCLVHDLVRAPSTASDDFMRIVDDWLVASASPEIECLIAATGLSRRQVERRCNALYGAPPKLLARKYRALKAAVALASGQAAIDDLLCEGFYDQSHLIREVKQFTGLTPGQLLAAPNPLARMTIDRRSALADRVSPLISGT